MSDIGIKRKNQDDLGTTRVTLGQNCVRRLDTALDNLLLKEFVLSKAV